MDPVTITIGFLAFAATAQAVAWFFNRATEEEKEHLSQLNSELKRQRKKYKEEKLLHFENIKSLIFSQVDMYRDYRAPLEKELLHFKNQIKSELIRPAISIYQKRALQQAQRRTEDAIYRLEAYFRYLDWYKNIIYSYEEKETYEKIDDLPTPEQSLPDDYLHVGKTVWLTKSEIEDFERRTNKYAIMLKLTPEEKLLIVRDEVPVLITKYWFPKENLQGIKYLTGILFGSIARGTLITDHLDDKNPSPFDVTCIEDSSNITQLLYKRLVKVILKREDKLTPLSKYYRGSEFKVYPLEWDLLLKKIMVTEHRPDNSPDDFERVLFLYDLNKNEEPKLEVFNEVQSLTYLPFNGDINNSQLIVRAQDTDFLVSIMTETNPYHIKILKVLKQQVKEQIRAEFTSAIDIMPNDVADQNFSIGSEEALLKLIDSIRKEFEYQFLLQDDKSYEQLSSNFINSWFAIIDKLMIKNEFRILYTGIYIEREWEYTNSEVKYLFSRHDYNNLLLQINNYREEVLGRKKDCRYDTLKIEVWTSFSFGTNISDQESNSAYQFHPIGELNNIDESEACITIKGRFDSRIKYSDIKWDEGHLLELRIRNSNYVFVQQKQALRRFVNSELINPELKRILLIPEILKQKTPNEHNNYTNIEFQNNSLTDNQKETVKLALKSEEAFFIQGPPGTGKTTVICEIVYQYLSKNPDSNVLIVAQQNVAVDNALEKIYERNRETWFINNKLTFIRCGNEDKVNSDIIKDYTIENWFSKYQQDVKSNNSEKTNFSELRAEWENLINKNSIRDVDPEIIQILLKRHQIIGTTCLGLASKRIGLDLLKFDLTIIDEAGRASPPELLIPILQSKKIILIGDHYQLPPIVCLDEDEASDIGVDKKFLENSLFQLVYERANSNKSVLLDQFRMPNKVGRLISDVFYDNIKPKLRNGRDKSPDDTYIFKEEIIWKDIKGNEKKETNGYSKFNLEEVTAIKKLIKEIGNRAFLKNRLVSVAIITPYGAHKRKMHEEISLKNWRYLTIKIDTIDSFQGQEADIVIYSTVRTVGNTVFILDKRRLNVAISRTKENLIFVGHKEFLRNAHPKIGEVECENYFKKIMNYIDS